MIQIKPIEDRITDMDPMHLAEQCAEHLYLGGTILGWTQLEVLQEWFEHLYISENLDREDVFERRKKECDFLKDIIFAALEKDQLRLLNWSEWLAEKEYNEEVNPEPDEPICDDLFGVSND